MKYAKIIVDISHVNLDRAFDYGIPAEWEEKAVVGALVEIPFGRGDLKRRGYIVRLCEEPDFDKTKIKSILRVVEEGIVMESHLIALAYWMHEQYGSALNDALRTVLPVREKVKQKEKKQIVLAVSSGEGEAALLTFRKKSYRARIRLMQELIENKILDYGLVTDKLNISLPTLRGLEKLGLIRIESQTVYRNPVRERQALRSRVELNPMQRAAAEDILSEYRSGKRGVYLIHGITGSGKTEVYMEVMEQVIETGKQVIFLIPEIALTYQMVLRFYKRFGDRISIINSRLSKGEKYDQFQRARNAEIDIMIGPRSALFTPFPNLGLIVIDEEHEGSYKSENPPKYHAREVAEERARLLGASVILGSATPSLESYEKARQGIYKLYRLDARAGEGTLPHVWIVDLREELKEKNKSIFSRKLKNLIEDRLEKRQQIMLFLNRRGYAGFVSCRSCGHVLQCPHCSVSLTSHSIGQNKNGKLVCHYCGYEIPFPDKCPECGSPYVAAFGLGTQKVEELAGREFPGARILRMDLDTTSGKEGHRKILEAFANQEADILIGTQMIVKGHDFPDVTLVGILAADLSLYGSDFRCSERTFQLLAQAGGRAGRGQKAGEVVIQTYNPEHYSIQAAANHNYEQFYEEEIRFRQLLGYPPAGNMLVILMTSREEGAAAQFSELLAKKILEFSARRGYEDLAVIGPSWASVGRVNDIWRRVLYLKHRDYGCLVEIKNELEHVIQTEPVDVKVQFDFNPMISY
ncbi:replication restart helicase PriA [Anaerolentibacter hominis]|uniref:replication restart helicase PriA n=1 Tax=Anaerolentibacter hominis TaxID=3079009 RepID=UPI0031B8546E